MHVLLKGLWWPLKTYEKAIDFSILSSINGIGICYSSIDESAYLWRHPYREKDLEKISELAKLAKENKLSFFVMLNPTVTSFNVFISNYKRIRKAFGVAPSQCQPDSPMNFDEDKDIELLLEKVKILENVGVNEFMICFDDAACDQDPKREAMIVNRINSIADKVMLTPFRYNLKQANETYLKTLGKELDKSTEVFWTGKDVVSLQVSKEEEIQFAKMLGRVPSLWLNYPANDYLNGEIIKEPLPKSEIHLLKGKSLLINPMFQFEESKVPILTVLDHIHQGDSYDPEKSWERAMHL